MSVNVVLGLGIELPQESCLGTKKVVGSVLKKSPMSTFCPQLLKGRRDKEREGLKSEIMRCNRLGNKDGLD